MVEDTIHRLAQNPRGRELLAELCVNALSGLNKAEAPARLVLQDLAEYTQAWGLALDASQAKQLGAALADCLPASSAPANLSIDAKRVGPGPGVAGHVRVVTLANGAHVRSLFVHCERAEVAFEGKREALHALFPAIKNVASALRRVQDECAPSSISRSPPAKHLIAGVEEWIQRPELGAEQLKPLHELLTDLLQAATPEFFEIRQACLDQLVTIGDAHSGDDARSIELGLLLAAMSAGFRSTGSNNVTITTGAVDSTNLSVSPIEHLVEKIEGVLAWAKKRKNVQGGVFIYPQMSRLEFTNSDQESFTDAQRNLQDLGIECVGVGTVWEAWEAIPRPRTRLISGREAALGAMIAVWYFERVAIGEYAGDPLTVARLGWTRGIVLSVVAGVVMGALFVGEFDLGSRLKSVWGRRALAFSYFPAAALVLLLFHATGALGLPPVSQDLKNAEAQTRIAWVWKDMVGVYPLVLTFASLTWRSLRAHYLARRLREAGLVFLAREALNPRLDRFEWVIHRGYPFLAGVFVMAMLALVGYDFFWYAQNPNKNWWMIFHIPFQAFWGLLCLGYAPFALRGRDAG